MNMWIDRIEEVISKNYLLRIQNFQSVKEIDSDT